MRLGGNVVKGRGFDPSLVAEVVPYVIPTEVPC